MKAPCSSSGCVIETLKSMQPPQTWRVISAPGSALSFGMYSVRSDWHALSDSLSPGPPDGPGEYLPANIQNKARTIE